MKKALKILAFGAVALCLLAFSYGCETMWSTIVGRNDQGDIDVDQMATYFDGEPKVRPGIALAIAVTATGSSGTAAKQYFVDAEGYITMELVGRIKCDGLTLVGLQEKIAAARAKRDEALRIPDWLDYDKCLAVRYESREKLKKTRPETLAQASMIPGVNPADISVLAIIIKRGHH